MRAICFLFGEHFLCFLYRGCLFARAQGKRQESDYCRQEGISCQRTRYDEVDRNLACNIVSIVIVGFAFVFSIALLGFSRELCGWLWSRQGHAYEREMMCTTCYLNSWAKLSGRRRFGFNGIGGFCKDCRGFSFFLVVSALVDSFCETQLLVSCLGLLLRRCRELVTLVSRKTADSGGGQSAELRLEDSI